MMYANQQDALKALAKISGRRAERLEHEGISPAEEWLLNMLAEREAYYRIHLNKKGRRNYSERKRIGLARCLGLWPIPAWYEVRRRMIESVEPSGYPRTVKSKALGLVIETLMSEPADLEKYVTGKFDYYTARSKS